ncbi:MAG: SDR family oxidoreductase [Ideonella sp.]|nr:SDR family oxidoreductase [Ideonella sp.]MCC7456643.1 SDR family oxidoreductase [Nitrospira sp.]
MTSAPFRLDGQVALVTGAGRGIGAAAARRLAEAGARVMLANRTLDAAQAVAEALRGDGLDAQASGFADSPEGCADAVARTQAAFGALDIVVHNAGGGLWAALDALTDEQLEATLRLNLKTCFWLTRAALPALKARAAAAAPGAPGGGRIVITSSVTGPRVAMLDSAHYAAAKAGVNGFVRSAALELAPLGITVNAVEPGFVAKDRGRLSRSGTREALVRQIPRGRAGVPDDIAVAMLFLASREAEWITGQTIVVDGGMTLPESAQVIDELHRRHPRQGGGA